MGKPKDIKEGATSPNLNPAPARSKSTKTEVEFELDKRKFKVLVKSAYLHGIGKRSAKEIAGDKYAQEYLVRKLDNTGASGIIREIF